MGEYLTFSKDNVLWGANNLFICYCFPSLRSSKANKKWVRRMKAWIVHKTRHFTNHQKREGITRFIEFALKRTFEVSSSFLISHMRMLRPKKQTWFTKNSTSYRSRDKTNIYLFNLKFGLFSLSQLLRWQDALFPF